MQIPVPVRRAVYRVGYRALQVVWALTRAQTHGVKCVITDGDLVLLVRHTYGSRAWDLPGGGMYPGEPPLKTAEREMAEELGITLTAWEDIGELHEAHGPRHDTLHCVRAEVGSPELTITIDRGELSVARWFPRAALPPDLSPHVIPILARTTVRRDGR
jgi:8-oxo-dGTP pyrophosphatase MutT (NUDIX family)